jgi:hypothetical protein
VTTKTPKIAKHAVSETEFQFKPIPPGIVIEVKLARYEAHALLRLLATACDAERTEQADRSIGTWLAERLLRNLQAAEQAAIEAE